MNGSLWKILQNLRRIHTTGYQYFQTNLTTSFYSKLEPEDMDTYLTIQWTETSSDPALLGCITSILIELGFVYKQKKKTDCQLILGIFEKL